MEGSTPPLPSACCKTAVSNHSWRTLWHNQCSTASSCHRPFTDRAPNHEGKLSKHEGRSCFPPQHTHSNVFLHSFEMPCIILKPGLHVNGVDMCVGHGPTSSRSLLMPSASSWNPKTLTDLRTDILCDMTAPKVCLKHSSCDTTTECIFPVSQARAAASRSRRSALAGRRTCGGW